MPELCRCGGCEFLAAVVAHPGGRWTAELRQATASQLAGAGISLPALDQPLPPTQLVGFALMRGWRLASGTEHSLPAISLIQMSQRCYFQRSSSTRFLVYEVIDSCSLDLRVDMVTAIGHDWLLQRPELAASQLLDGLSLAQVRLSLGGAELLQLEYVMTEWRRAYPALAEGSVLWAVAPVVADALVTGLCSADVSVLTGREARLCQYDVVPPQVALEIAQAVHAQFGWQGGGCATDIHSSASRT